MARFDMPFSLRWPTLPTIDSMSRPSEQLAGDEELMLAVRAGDLSAFEVLVLRHQSAVWKVASRFLGDPIEAEDVAQEVFLKILGAACRYKPSASFRAYVYRITIRLCLDQARKKRPTRAPNPSTLCKSASAPSDSMIAAERERAVRRALAELAPSQRGAVVLRYYEGMNYAEIAEAMELSTKAVERLLARGRAKLQARLAHLLD
jgi:RNA polymerase sigma-70 factor (ECF subfamily)